MPNNALPSCLTEPFAACLEELQQVEDGTLSRMEAFVACSWWAAELRAVASWDVPADAKREALKLSRRFQSLARKAWKQTGTPWHIGKEVQAAFGND
jgi:hypothetical protein